jgi:5-methylcytosine-specific restriction enzyme subunit McrC
MTSDIPVQNIYYMLLYAWNALDEADDPVNVHVNDCTKLVDLFACVLHSGMERLMRRGLDRGYIGHKERIAGVRGKMDFGASVKTGSLLLKRTICEFDEFSHNILHNQIIKTTIRQLLATGDLSSELCDKLASVNRRLHDVDVCRLSERSFRGVQLHRNNRHYRLLLNVCRLIYRASLTHEHAGEHEFRNFFRKDERMRLLFERFVRNFYWHESRNPGSNFRVDRKSKVTWAGLAGADAHLNRVPGMWTDIRILMPNRILVFETKFVPKMFQLNPRSGKKTIRSGHLYQLFAYVANLSITHPNKPVEGILLYPAAEAFHQDIRFQIAGRQYRAVTLNLNQDWRKIRDDLLDLLNPTFTDAATG